MSIALIITDGYGNGTLAGTPSDVILHGFSIGEDLGPWTEITDTTTAWSVITDTTTIWVGICSDDPGKGIIGLGRVGCMRVGRDFTSWA